MFIFFFFSSTNSTTTKVTVPESITSSSVSGFSLHPSNGLGVLRNPLLVTTFKPFFVQIVIPQSAKLGEIVNAVLVVHNYLDKETTVEVTLDATRGDFDVVASAKSTIEVCLNGVNSTIIPFLIKRQGLVPIKVQAVSPIACDTAQTTLNVEPAGVTITRTISRPLLLKSSGSYMGNFSIDIPANAVPGSVKTQLTVQGDKYSLDFVNSRKTVAEPTGSGAEFMLGFLDYSSNIKAGPPTCDFAAKLAALFAIGGKMINTQCPDGGYRLDEDCDQPDKDATYTATMAKLIYVAIPLGNTETGSMFRSFDYLARIQRPDGSFPNPRPLPKVFVEGPIATAFIAYTLLEASTYLPIVAVKYNETIERAMNYVFDQLTSLDILSLSMLCRVAQFRNDPRKGDLLTRIEARAEKKEDTLTWVYGTLIEASTYILESYRATGQLINSLRAGNGLVKFEWTWPIRNPFRLPVSCWTA
jgi:CD109 antigen